MDLATHGYTARSGKRTTSGVTDGSSRRSNDTALQPSANVGKWANWSFTYDGVDSSDYSSYKIYYNGEEKDDGTMGSAGNSGEENATRWGLDRNGAGAFNGYIGRVTLYDKELTAAQIKQNHEATKPRFEPRITKSGLVVNLDAGDPNSYSESDSDPAGTTWTDTANGYNATLVNTIYSSEGGGSMDLDGTDDSVTISSNAAGDFAMKGWSVLTYEFWIKRTDATGWGRLLYESTQTSGGFLVGPAFSGSNYYAYIDTDDGSSGSAISGWGSTTDWIHLATTYDGSDVVTYRNGVQVGTQSLTGDIKDTSGSYGGVVFGRTNHGGSDWFSGRVATIRVYQAALSAAEVMDNYQKTKGRFGH